jgi:DNA-binding MarR family transcriptional regulator
MPSRRDQDLDPPADTELADRLHSAAIHLLRRLRVEDAAAGLSAPRLSALSVIVFGGPIAMNELARAEQVSPPTISRLADGLQADGLVERIADPGDRRVQLLRATRKGRRLLEEGRRRRVRALARALEPLSAADRRLLERAAHVLQRISLPDRHPGQGS